MKKISFITDDGIKLDGLLYETNNYKDEVVISIHGMSSNCFKKRDDIFQFEFNKKKISYFCFNNRGHDFVNSLNRYAGNEKTKVICGTSFEDVLDSYYDIKSAIDTMLNMGYKKVHLMGHSLGSTKIVYTYNKLILEENNLIDKISSVILLSLVDIPEIMKYYLKDEYTNVIDFALNMEKENKLDELMPVALFGFPMCVKTFLRYAKYNEEINFAKYSDYNFNFNELNNINSKLFMRFGNENEMIIGSADDLIVTLNNKIKIEKKDINYIPGADHSYSEKELELANEILDFIIS